MTYGGHAAITYFFASSGGMTESVQDGFPGAESEPWLVGVADSYEGAAARWKAEIPFGTAAKRLRGLYRGQFHGVEVVRRGVSPRVLVARVLGTAAASIVSGATLAGRLGLDSTWEYFYVRTGTALRPEPDHSGRARLFGPLTGSSPNPPPAPRTQAASRLRAAAAPRRPSSQAAAPRRAAEKRAKCGLFDAGARCKALKAGQTSSRRARPRTEARRERRRRRRVGRRAPPAAGSTRPALASRGRVPGAPSAQRVIARTSGQQQDGR